MSLRKLIPVDRRLPVQSCHVTAESLVIDATGFEFSWSIAPTRFVPGSVEDPDTVRVRTELFVKPLVRWKIRDSSGRRYAHAGSSQDGDLEKWNVKERFEPAPPTTVSALVMVLHFLVEGLQQDEEDSIGAEIETVRVDLTG